MPDFTIQTYKRLLRALPLERAQILRGHFENPRAAALLLRHDVDARPDHSLRFAEIQSSLGVRGTYYFRASGVSAHPDVMERIALMGHEIGYHYEDVAEAWRTRKRDGGGRAVDPKRLIDAAYASFRLNLERFRMHFDIRTICAHGSPLCPYDNELIWSQFDYRPMGILGDAGRDVDFSEFEYLTDTGRRWDGARFSLRDKSPSGDRMRIRSSFDILRAVRSGAFPERIMMTFHPQRWNGDPARWAAELAGQPVKNLVKYCIAWSRRSPDGPGAGRNRVEPRA
jgi:hypothetical protein